MTRFDLIYFSLAPVAVPYLAYKSVVHGKYRESAPAMFGRGVADEDDALWKNGSVWVHAVSVGEVIAAKAMLPLLRREFAGTPVLLTTVTETGQAQARTLVPDLADAARYYPADFSWVVRRFAAKFRPRVFVLMETELWPNALRIASESGTRIFVVNGKISDKSYGSYRRLQGLMRDPLSRVAAFCMQTQIDADRAATLCGDPDRVFVTGNCKFDVPFKDVSDARAAELRAMCRVPDDAEVIMVGSTHPGEEQVMLDVMKMLAERRPNAVMLIAPRHPERFGAVWDMVVRSGFSARRVSDGSSAGDSGRLRVVLVDVMGVLAELYAISTVAVVAGSFVPGIGGHNLLEASYQGVPVVRGPYMEKQPDMVRILDGAEAAAVAHGADLGPALLNLLEHPANARAMGKCGRQAVLVNRGAAERNMQIIRRYMSA
jgi:3-deoxy-D-manno-octulosonic-acid transferase